MLVHKFQEYTLDNDGLIRYNEHIYIPHDNKLRNYILNKSHRAVYMDHIGAMKMREDLNPLFFWK
jgi:hypothetical protein